MRKIMAVLTVAATLIITPLVLAAELKVPKLLCIDMDNYPDKHQLAIKPSGPIYDPIGNPKTYTIAGRDQYGVISGSGYVMPGTTIFYANYSGTHIFPHKGLNSDGIPQNSTYHLVIDLTKKDGAGLIDFTFQIPEYQGEEINTLSSFSNCSLVDIIQCQTLSASFDGLVPGTAAFDRGQKLNECPR